jgi:hypothetical protein
VIFWPKPTKIIADGERNYTSPTLSAGQASDLSIKLAAASSNMSMNRVDEAKSLYLTALGIDCSNEEARRGIAAVDKAALQKIISDCPYKNWEPTGQ